MAVYLDEEMFGSDNKLIGFPHLLLCMGFVMVVRRGDLKEIWGVHLTSASTAQRSFAVFAQYCRNDMAIAPNMIRSIYGSCNRSERYRTHDTMQAWQDEMWAFAGQLGYKGHAYGFDTCHVDPLKGTYVEYQIKKNKDACHVYYKRDGKMEYGKKEEGHGALGIQTSDTKITDFKEHQRNNPKFLDKVGDKARPGQMSRSFARPIPKGFGLKRELKEVDFATRMDMFTIV